MGYLGNPSNPYNQKKQQTKNNDNYIYVIVLFNIMGCLGNPSNPYNNIGNYL